MLLFSVCAGYSYSIRPCSYRAKANAKAKKIKEIISNIKENFVFASAFDRCEWVLMDKNISLQDCLTIFDVPALFLYKR